MALGNRNTIESLAFVRVLALPSSVIGMANKPSVFIFTALMLFVFSVTKPESVGIMRGHIYDVMTPALSAIAEPVQNIILTARNAASLTHLQKDNAYLNAELVRLTDWERQARTLRDENTRLRALLNLAPPSGYSTITAHVLADGGQAFAHTVLVDVGGRDGIKVGQAAMVSGGLAGRVLEVSDGAARILLLTDINAQIPVIVGQEGLRAVLAGTNETQGVLLYLPPGAQVKQGDHIVTSGDGGLIPPGIPVGQVEIHNISNQDTQRVSFYADFGTLTHMRIVSLPPSPIETFLRPVEKTMHQ